MKAAAKILLIEDDLSIAESLRQVLAQEGHAVTSQERGDAGLRCAQEETFDAVVTDLRLPGLGGLEVVRKLHLSKPRLPIILITAHGTTETAIEATKLGAFDYLLKPFEMTEFLALVSKAVATSRLMTAPVQWGSVDPHDDAIVGSSRIMQSLYKDIGRVANKPVTILIRGETGTGKELIARAIYQHGDRAGAPFVAVNCGAIPENLLESELFGHERGAFTGAEARRIGRFEQAEGGTIFLDEIGDLIPSTQVKLLRVLQERALQRVGGKETIRIDVRVIAATHCDLELAMQNKTFREDLFYRLSVAVVHVPPLRDRVEDIPELVRYFLGKHGPDFGVSNPSILPEAVQFLQQRRWPGNVRELENVVRQALLLARGFTITPEHLREVTRQGSPLPTTSATQSLRDHAAQLMAAAQRGEILDAHARLLEAAEREILSQAIQLAQGNQAKAARWLGVSRLTLREKLTRFGLHPNQDEPAKVTA